MKSADVEIICSEKIDAEHLGIFSNSFHLTNYEWCIKDDKKPEKAHEDERMDRKSKVIDSVEISHEKGTAQDSYIKKMVMAEATNFSRNLANVRGSTATPEYMEHQVRALCDQHKDLIKEVRVLCGQQLLDENMNLFHGVGRAAVSEPRMVLVHYEGDPASKETTALVGKGITYDTGGLNLKQTGFMELMYGDKNGSCAVIGALHGVLASKPKLNIVFAMAFADNAIDSKS
jgi:leucyl aminopeptidase